MAKPTFSPISLKAPDGHVIVTLSYDTEHDLIYADWQNHLTANEVIMAGEKYLELIEKFPCSRLLSDKSKVTGDWSDANDWLEYSWIPDAINAGLTCFAYILSEDIYNRLSGLDLYKRLSGELKFDLFSNPKNAIEWLASCK